MTVWLPSFIADKSISPHPAGIVLTELSKTGSGIVQVFEISMESQLTINTRMSEIK